MLRINGRFLTKHESKLAGTRYYYVNRIDGNDVRSFPLIVGHLGEEYKDFVSAFYDDEYLCGELTVLNYLFGLE